MARRKYVQIENKNALLEMLHEDRSIEKIYLANNAFRDDRTTEILDIARDREIPIEKVARKMISRRSKTSSNENVIGLMLIDNMMDLGNMLDNIYESGKDPFILVMSDLKYPKNIAEIFRTAFAAGVNGVITPIQKGNLLTDEVVRISMGTCLRIPIAEMNIFSALKTLNKEGVEICVLGDEGEPIYDTVLVGPKAFLLESEYNAVSTKLAERSDRLLSIPMSPGLGSLNIGVSTALLVYEKYRQERVMGKMEETIKPTK